MQAPSLALTSLMPDVLIAASFLPASDALRDPADRILAATAREYGHRLITRDRKLLDYAAEGHLQAIEC
jgi:PIN domain nuclease of toxin-antitoxin system